MHSMGEDLKEDDSDSVKKAYDRRWNEYCENWKSLIPTLREKIFQTHTQIRLLTIELNKLREESFNVARLPPLDKHQFIAKLQTEEFFLSISLEDRYKLIPSLIKDEIYPADSDFLTKPEKTRGPWVHPDNIRYLYEGKKDKIPK